MIEFETQGGNLCQSLILGSLTHPQGQPITIFVYFIETK